MVREGGDVTISPVEFPPKSVRPLVVVSEAEMMRAMLRVAVLAAAASCVLAEKGDLYGKDGKEKGSIVEVRSRVLRSPSVRACVSRSGVPRRGPCEAAVARRLLARATERALRPPVLQTVLVRGCISPFPMALVRRHVLFVQQPLSPVVACVRAHPGPRRPGGHEGFVGAGVHTGIVLHRACAAPAHAGALIFQADGMDCSRSFSPFSPISITRA